MKQILWEITKAINITVAFIAFLFLLWEPAYHIGKSQGQSEKCEAIHEQ